MLLIDKELEKANVLLDRCLNRHLVEAAMSTRLDQFSEYLLNTNKNIEGIYTPNINVPKLDDFNNSYILGIYGDLKFAQYSTNYIFDDLMNIKSFLETENKKFMKNLQKLFFINDKYKLKCITKSVKKDKPTIYNNNELGAKILDYIAGNLKEYSADKYGMQNYILDNLAETDSYKRKLIIILSFDVEMFEIYYSIPLEMYQKGSVELEDDLIYACRLDEIEPNVILENIENYFAELTGK